MADLSKGAPKPTPQKIADKKSPFIMDRVSDENTPAGAAQWMSAALGLGFLTGFLFSTAYLISVAKRELASASPATQVQERIPNSINNNTPIQNTNPESAQRIAPPELPKVESEAAN